MRINDIAKPLSESPGMPSFVDDLATNQSVTEFPTNKKFRFRFDGFKGSKESRVNQIFEWNPEMQEFMYISPQGRYQIQKDASGKASYQTVPRYSVLELSIFNKLGWRDTSSPKSVKEVPSVTYDKVKYDFDKESGKWVPNYKAKQKDPYSGQVFTTAGKGTPVAQGSRLEMVLFKKAGYTVKGYKELYGKGGKGLGRTKDIIKTKKDKKQSKFKKAIDPQQGDFFNQRGIKKYPILFPINLPRRILVGTASVIGKVLDGTAGLVYSLFRAIPGGDRGKRDTTIDGDKVKNVDLNPQSKDLNPELMPDDPMGKPKEKK